MPIFQDVPPKSKDSACGDVDNKIKQLMKEPLVNVKLFAAESRSRTLFVLISGDRDFAPEIKDIRSAGLDIAVIHNPDNPLSPDMVSLLAGKEWAPCAWLNILNLARKKDVPISIVPMIKPEHPPKTVISTPVKAAPVVPSSDSKAAATETIKIKFPTHKALFTKGFELDSLKISLEAICADIFVELQQSEPKKIELLVHFENPKDATPKNKAEIQSVTRAYLDTIYEIIFPLYGVSHDMLRKHPQYSSLKSKCRVFSREFKVPDEKVEASVDPASTASKKAWFDLYDDESVGVINVALLGTNEEKLLEVKRYLLSLSEQKIKIKIPNERLYLLCQRAWPIIKPEAVVSSISKDEVTLTGPQDAIDLAIAELQAKLRTIQQLKVNVPKPNPKQSKAGLKMALKEDIKLIYDDLRSNLLLIHISDNVSAPAPVVASALQSPKGKGSSTVAPAVAPGAIPFSVSVLTISPPVMSFGALTEGKALTDSATEGSSSEGAFIDGSAIKQRLEKLLKEYNERYVAVSDIRKSLSTAPPVILKLLRSNFPDLLGCRVTQSGFLCLQGKVVDIEEVVDFLTVEPKTEKATFAFIEREKVFVDWCKRNKRDVTTVIENLSKKHPGVKFVTHALKATVVVRLQGLLASLQPARSDAELKFDELNAKLVKRSLPMTPYDFQFLHSDRAALEDKALKACVVLQHTVVAETATTAVEDGCVLLATAKFGVTELRVMRGSMLDVCSQAILNPANPTLSHGAGAARAIRDAAGEEIDQEGQKLLLEKSGGKIPVGESVITKAYKLTERNQRLTHVIHAVGPVYRSGDAKERKLYRSTIHSALHLAMVNDIKEVAIPLFGSGVYGWPCSVAATELVLAISEWLAKSDSEMEQITLIDVVEDTVITILQSLRKFAERNPNDDDTSSSDVDDDLLVALPRIATPINSWSWEVAQNEQFKLADKSWKDENGQSWVRYDYQQNLIIEGAFGPNGLPPPVGNGVIIRGDIGGILSDSKFVPEGERSAVYAIFRDNCISDVSRKPYAFYQKNMKSSFRRAVRCDPFTPDMKIFGFNDVDDEEDVVVRPISGDGVKVKSFDNGDLCPVIIIEDFLLSKAAVVDGSVQMKADTAANQKMINVFGTNDAITAFDQKLSKLLKANAKESEPIDFPPSEPWNTLRLKLLSQLASLAIEVEVTDVSEYQVVLKTTGDLFLFKAVAAVTKFAKKLVDEMPDKEFAVQWPSYWENSAVSSSSDDTTRLYDVAQGSSEWEQVIEQLLWPKQTFNKKVVKVDRIQNPKAYAAYYTKLLFLASKSNNRTGTLTEKANEKIMKHGTRNTEPSEIYKNDYGLDHKYSAAEGNYYGQAAYTAEDAEYSHSYRYNIPGSKPQLSQILLVRVAAGNIFEVKQRTAEHTKWKRAPPGFDTVRGDVRDGNHFAIMVYSAEYAYPDYLVTYEA
jgi:O-acetyl-ADP-ribose deacetylase (regulator of RNase III)